MILLVALTISFLIALLRGGHLLNLISLPLRWPAAPIVVVAVQAIVIFNPQPQSPKWGFVNLHVALLVLSYLFLSLVIWINRRIPGMVLLEIGLLLNLAVMLANGGYMPITPDAMASIGNGGQVEMIEPGTRDPASKDIVLLREQTRLWILSDIFVLAKPFPLPTAFSLGDVLIAWGLFQVVQHALLAQPASLSSQSTPRRKTKAVALFHGSTPTEGQAQQATFSARPSDESHRTRDSGRPKVPGPAEGG
jgi:hypothetical protein